ncbi:MAG: deoxyribonuclease [Gammaproteobacteria bacterium]|nr:deoxyribonuclease [Gammaproteobacteria bacterium]
MNEDPDTEFVDSDIERRSGPWRLILIVAFVTLIGVLLVPGESPQAPAPVSGNDTGAVAPSLLDDARPAAAPGVTARQLIAESRAATDPGLDRIVDTAREMQANGAQTDAYLLLFYAAREGHAGAALTLAEQADPAHRDPTNSFHDSADLAQAYKWYVVAIERGSTAAQQRLAALKRHIEKLARNGDEQAQRLALKWQ